MADLDPVRSIPPVGPRQFDRQQSRRDGHKGERPPTKPASTDPVTEESIAEPTPVAGTDVLGEALDRLRAIGDMSDSALLRVRGQRAYQQLNDSGEPIPENTGEEPTPPPA